MNNIFYLILIVITLVSCNNNKKLEPISEPVVSAENTAAKTPEIKTTSNKNKLYGYYVGDFIAEKFKKGGSHSNKITITITKIEGDSIFGHSIVAGNSRRFSGIIDARNNSAVIEPGDNKYDGKFEFQILPNHTTLTGQWTAFNNSLNVSKRRYVLKKRAFKYDPKQQLPEDYGWTALYDGKNFDGNESEFTTEDVLKHNASLKLLTKEDVENMYKGDLEILRNSIYARHGYSFKNRKMRYVFDQIDWYMPISVDVRNELTTIEVKNIELIKRYEQHAERYYDAFGR